MTAEELASKILQSGVRYSNTVLQDGVEWKDFVFRSKEDIQAYATDQIRKHLKEAAERAKIKNVGGGILNGNDEYHDYGA